MMPEMDGLELSKIIQEKYPEIKFLVLSSYDDFPYVSQSYKNGAVDYILKPTLNRDNLLEALTRVANQARLQKGKEEEQIIPQQLLRILNGYEQENFKDLQNFLKYPYYRLVYTNAKWYQEDQKVREAFENSELLEEKVTKKIPLFINNEELLLLIATPQRLQNQEINDLFHPISGKITNLFLVVSEPFENLTDLSSTYHFIKENAAGQKFYQSTEHLVEVNQFVDLNNGESFDTNKFIRALLNNDFLSSMMRIEDFFNAMILSFVRPVYLKQQSSSIFYTLLSSLEGKYPQNKTFKQLKRSFFNEVSKRDTVEQFSRTFFYFSDEIRKGLREESGEMYIEDELARDIASYINQNFRSPLTLGQLAEHFHFSYNYLSTFFSKEFKKSFKDYLSDIRLEEAKRLLLQSDLNLSEISDAIGYADLSYFSKIFKKEFGVSPSQYRRENRL